MGLFGGNSVTGLDLGTSSIKAVRMQAAKGGWQVAYASMVPTPRGAIVDGMVVDPKLLAPALRQLFSRGGLRTSELVIAINYTAAVVIRRTPLPLTKPDGLRKQIETQPDQLGLQSGKEFATDFDILALLEGDAPQMDTLLVSAPRGPVDSRLAALRTAGLEAVSVDIDPLALMRALVEARPGIAARTGGTAIVDLGDRHTDVTVVRGTNYIFTRAIPFGGDGLTEVVRQTVQCEPEEAEPLKQAVDLRLILDGPGERNDTPAFKATIAVKSVLDDLLKEIRNSILYYHAQLPEEDTEGLVDMILLTGGTARLNGLTEYMQVSFNCQVERAGFTDDFSYGLSAGAGDLSSDLSPVYALAVGLALKEPMDRERAATRAAAVKLQKARPPKKGKRAPESQAAEPTPAAR